MEGYIRGMTDTPSPAQLMHDSTVESKAAKLFKDLTISQIRAKETDTRVIVEQKRHELRELVGTRYRDLIDSADHVIEMKRVTQRLCGSLSQLEEGSRAVLKAMNAGREGTARVEDSQITPRTRMEHIGRIARKIKTLVDTPELIWSSLDTNSYFSAAVLYLHADATHRSLQTHSSSQDLLKSFPLIVRQWALISQFPSEIRSSSRKHLCKSGVPVLEHAAAVCGLILLEPCGMAEAFEIFLACRLEAMVNIINGVVGGATSSRDFSGGGKDPSNGPLEDGNDGGGSSPGSRGSSECLVIELADVVCHVVYSFKETVELAGMLFSGGYWRARAKRATGKASDGSHTPLGGARTRHGVPALGPIGPDPLVHRMLGGFCTGGAEGMAALRRMHLVDVPVPSTTRSSRSSSSRIRQPSSARTPRGDAALHDMLSRGDTGRLPDTHITARVYQWIEDGIGKIQPLIASMLAGPGGASGARRGEDLRAIRERVLSALSINPFERSISSDSADDPLVSPIMSIDGGPEEQRWSAVCHSVINADAFDVWARMLHEPFHSAAKTSIIGRFSTLRIPSPGGTSPQNGGDAPPKTLPSSSSDETPCGVAPQPSVHLSHYVWRGDAQCEESRGPSPARSLAITGEVEEAVAAFNAQLLECEKDLALLIDPQPLSTLSGVALSRQRMDSGDLRSFLQETCFLAIQRDVERLQREVEGIAAKVDGMESGSPDVWPWVDAALVMGRCARHLAQHRATTLLHIFKPIASSKTRRLRDSSPRTPRTPRSLLAQHNSTTAATALQSHPHPRARQVHTLLFSLYERAGRLWAKAAAQRCPVVVRVGAREALVAGWTKHHDVALPHSPSPEAAAYLFDLSREVQRAAGHRMSLRVGSMLARQAEAHVLHAYATVLESDVHMCKEGAIQMYMDVNFLLGVLAPGGRAAESVDAASTNAESNATNGVRAQMVLSAILQHLDPIDADYYSSLVKNQAMCAVRRCRALFGCVNVPSHQVPVGTTPSTATSVTVVPVVKAAERFRLLPIAEVDIRRPKDGGNTPPASPKPGASTQASAGRGAREANPAQTSLIQNLGRRFLPAGVLGDDSGDEKASGGGWRYLSFT